MAEQEWVRAAVHACLDSLSDHLIVTYGWTLFTPVVEFSTSQRRVIVRGTVPLRRVALRLRALLTSALPTVWKTTVAMNSLTDAASWFRLQEVTQVWREWLGVGSSSTLSSELLPKHGPVQVLARTNAGTLIRGRDATVGWTTQPVSRWSLRPDWFSSRAPSVVPWNRLASLFVDVPYKTGGTTTMGIDCSGLVQRMYRDHSGVIVPRHSTDQMTVLRSQRLQLRDGALVAAARGASDAPLHVGILIRSACGAWTVVHASSTRGKVVRDSLNLDYWL